MIMFNKDRTRSIFISIATLLISAVFIASCSENSADPTRAAYMKSCEKGFKNWQVLETLKEDRSPLVVMDPTKFCDCAYGELKKIGTVAEIEALSNIPEAYGKLSTEQISGLPRKGWAAWLQCGFETAKK